MSNLNSTRRAFLKVGAAVSLGALGATALGGCTALQPKVLSVGGISEEIEWDGVFDVVVIGFGAAGAASALSAAERGASVLLADKAPEGSEGGNSRYSSQLFVSIDQPQEALAYHQGLRGDFYTPDEVLEAYVSGLHRVEDTLVEWGAAQDEILDVTDFDKEAYLLRWQQMATDE